MKGKTMSRKIMAEGKRGFVGSIILFFAVLINMFALILLMILNPVIRGLSDESVSRFFKNSDLAAFDVSEFVDEDESYRLDEYIADEDSLSIYLMPLSRNERLEIIDKVLNNDNFKGYVAEKATGLKNYYMFGGDPVEIDRDETIEVIRGASEGFADIISDAFGESEFDKFNTQIKRNEMQSSLNLKNIRIYLIGAIILCTAIIFFVWRDKLYMALHTIGKNFLVAGIFGFIIIIIGKIYYSEALLVIEKLIYGLGKYYLIENIAIAVIGAVLLAICGFLRRMSISVSR
jgi:hypothetical protein